MGEKEIKKEMKEYAEKEGFKLNSNKKIVDNLMKGLVVNKKKYGELYCPCRVITGDKKEDKKIICPCVYHKKEIKDYGKCLCGLFEG